MSVEDITEPMLCFRNAASHIWNTYLRVPSETWNAEVFDARDNIEIELLRAMVLRRFGLSAVADSYRSGPLAEIIVVPDNRLSEIPLQVGDVAKNGNVTWSQTLIPIGLLPELWFCEFFDWDFFGHVTMGIVEVASSTGQRYLIEVQYCRFAVKTGR